MQRKYMIATILAVAALFATFTVANVDNNEADTGETTTYHISVYNGTTATLEFITNEITFYNIDPSITPVWRYGNTNGGYTEIIDSEVTISNPKNNASVYKFNLERIMDSTNSKSDCGKYTISFTDLSNTKSTEILALQCEITTDKGTDKEFTSLININIKISLNGASNLPSSFMYNDGKNDYELNGIHLKKGNIITLTPVLRDNLKATDYKWYVTGLPSGLSMVGSGVISGFTEKSEVINATIVLENSNGLSKTYSLEIAVYDTPGSYYYIYDGTFTAETTDANWSNHSPAQHITHQNGIVTLLIPTTDSNSHQTVTIIDGKGVNGRSELSVYTTITIKNGNMYHCYTLPTDGTGTYRVTIQKDTSEASFDLYVMPKITAIQSAIVVGSTGTR